MEVIGKEVAITDSPIFSCSWITCAKIVKTGVVNINGSLSIEIANGWAF